MFLHLLGWFFAVLVFGISAACFGAAVIEVRGVRDWWVILGYTVVGMFFVLLCGALVEAILS